MNELSQAMETNNRTRLVLVFMSVVLSGTVWYFANELSGDYGYLMWIAPVPVLFISLKSSGRIAFLASFAAFFLGKLSWYSYLIPLLGIAPLLIYFVFASLIFAGVVLAFRQFSLKVPKWYSVLVFPICYTLVEFMMLKFAPDGSAGSMVYSQMNYLPVIQLASLTGMLGITFHLCLVASVLSLGIYHFRDRALFIKLVSLGMLVSISSLLYGVVRLSDQSDDAKYMKAGLVVLDEKYHHFTRNPDVALELETATAYLKEINALAEKGAELVLLPERAINITAANEAEITSLFSGQAKEKQLFIILGYTNYRSSESRNSVLVFDKAGEIIQEYNKANLIVGLEDEFVPGSLPGLFNFRGLNLGTAICKDLDFPDFINNYQDIHLMAVPAWDFVVDDWLHSRMAILRSVENGFSQIRAARQGALTANDSFGRVISEVSAADENQKSLLVQVPLSKRKTPYAQFGNWFGFLNVGLLVMLGFLYQQSRGAIEENSHIR